ncbi:reverse transcriptase [Gossypium australe]|uniref:Reverse transcriptase n=1 Tax=Gossypium australe TaxID=47621 RepID=A0A5B6UP44_9ROSI|nr:reverse transcriptase [Gossypium australe]
MEDFRNTLQECQLHDIGFSGRWFTWERGNLPETNIRERLDRGVANTNWISMFPEAKIRHLVHSTSDHCPLLISTEQEECQKRNEAFRFEAWWILEETFEAETQRNDDNLAEMIDTKVQLNFEIDKDESHWEQRARVNWLKMGDRNTAFFHSMATQRRKKNLILKLQNNEGIEIGDQQEMAETARLYFQDLFKTEGIDDPEHLLNGVEKSISEEDNRFLMRPYTQEELRSALASMGATKAPGEDGFPAIFFQKLWHIVGEEVSTYCLAQLNGGMEVSEINTTHIVLIPKKRNPTNLTHFRPISLCNVIYKMMAKVIADRFKGVLERCIDKAQSAFVPGRLISDNVLVAYKILHTLKRKRWGSKGLMAVKLDMSRAYDRVEWGFLEKMMSKMGFNPNWIHLIMKCISTGLSSLIRVAQQEENLKGVKASRSGPQISHLLFADDCITFGEATERGAGLLKKILQEYRRCSGQIVNFEKSNVFFSSNTGFEKKRMVSQMLGVRSSNDPEGYLGLPNMVGRRKKAAFQILKDRLKKRIDNWSTRHLSQGGKEVFIKSVLQAIPTYSMACFLLPKTLCSDLEKIIAKFWWQKGHGQRGIHWCTWNNLCFSKEHGGMGFRRFDQFNIALLAKQGWRIINYPSSLLSQVFKAKYFPKSDFSKAELGNSPSFTWRSVWAAKGLLENGLCWRVGKGDQISIWEDRWITGGEIINSRNDGENTEIKLVADLIEESTRSWKRDVIENTFPEYIALKIKQIPLAEEAHDDFKVWRGEHTGEFTVRSAYQLLQQTTLNPNELILQAKTKTFYRKLWNLQLPSKLLITIWRISRNFLPNFKNLSMRRVVNDSTCPRCRAAEEDCDHTFRQCPVSIETWRLINLSWVLNPNINDIWDWLTWGALSSKIQNYVAELDRSRERELTDKDNTSLRQQRQGTEATILFDAAFDSKNATSASGLVVKGENNEWLASKSIIHSEITSPFMAEAHAGLQAVKLGISLGFKSITLLGDSKTTINKCNSTNRDKSVLGAVIRDIQNLKKHFRESLFSFINRRHNSEAHTIATETLRTGEEIYLEERSFSTHQRRRRVNGDRNPD